MCVLNSCIPTQKKKKGLMHFVLDGMSNFASIINPPINIQLIFKYILRYLFFVSCNVSIRSLSESSIS